MEEFHQKKSCLRSSHAKEVKALEKKLKKKRDPQRDQVEAELQTVLHRHEKELKDLEVQYSVTRDKQRDLRVEDSKTEDVCNPVEEKINDIPLIPNNWESMSNKELRQITMQCNLGKKGNREQLVSKLMQFHNDQQGKLHNQSEPFLKNNNDSLDAKSCDHQKPLGKEARKKEKTSNKEDARQDSSSSESSDNTSEVSEEDATLSEESQETLEDEDVPDAQRQLGGSKEDTRGLHKRKTQHKPKPARRDDMKNKADNVQTSSTSHTSDEQRQMKREKVMQQVLLKVTSKFKDGLSVNQIPFELEGLNVINFRPSLCGYSSLHDWLSHQPPHIIRYNPDTQKIYPARPQRR